MLSAPRPPNLMAVSLLFILIAPAYGDNREAKDTIESLRTKIASMMMKSTALQAEVQELANAAEADELPDDYYTLYSYGPSGVRKVVPSHNNKWSWVTSVVFTILVILATYLVVMDPNRQLAIASIIAVGTIAVELYFFVVKIQPADKPIFAADQFTDVGQRSSCAKYCSGLLTTSVLLLMHLSTNAVLFIGNSHPGNLRFNWFSYFWQVTTDLSVFSTCNPRMPIGSSYVLLVVGSAHLVFGDLQLSLCALSRLRGDKYDREVWRTSGYTGNQEIEKQRDADQDKSIFMLLTVAYLFGALLLTLNYHSWQLFLIFQKGTFVVHASAMFIYFFAMVLISRGAEASNKFWLQFRAHAVHLAGDWIPALLDFLGASAYIDIRLVLGALSIIQAVCWALIELDDESKSVLNYVSEIIKMESNFVERMLRRLEQFLCHYGKILCRSVFWWPLLFCQLFNFYSSYNKTSQNISQPFKEGHVVFGQYYCVSEYINFAGFAYIQIFFLIGFYLRKFLMPWISHMRFFAQRWDKEHLTVWSLTSAMTVFFAVYNPTLGSLFWWVVSLIHVLNLLMGLSLAHACVRRVSSSVWISSIISATVFVFALAVVAFLAWKHGARMFIGLSAVGKLIVNVALAINPVPSPTEAPAPDWVILGNWAIFLHVVPEIFALAQIHACYYEIVVLLTSVLSLLCTLSSSFLG